MRESEDRRALRTRGLLASSLPLDITSWRLLKDELVGGIGGTLWVLMGTAGIVLLIACANVANLLLVRADGRRQELAIRAALGAGRIRMARDLLLESGLLGVAGGVLGLTLAFGVLRALAAYGPEHLPRVHEIGIDPAVLAFTLGISLASGLLFGLIPVWQQMRPHLSGGLRGGGRSLEPEPGAAPRTQCSDCGAGRALRWSCWLAPG